MVRCQVGVMLDRPIAQCNSLSMDSYRPGCIFSNMFHLDVEGTNRKTVVSALMERLRAFRRAIWAVPVANDASLRVVDRGEFLQMINSINLDECWIQQNTTAFGDADMPMLQGAAYASKWLMVICGLNPGIVPNATPCTDGCMRCRAVQLARWMASSDKRAACVRALDSRVDALGKPAVADKAAVIVVDMQNDFIPVDSTKKYTKEEAAENGWDDETLDKMNDAAIGAHSQESAFAPKEFATNADRDAAANDCKKVIRRIQALLVKRRADLCVFSMDDHPAGHISFLDHKDEWTNRLDDEDERARHTQLQDHNRYPAHCVHDTWGQRIVPDLRGFSTVVEKINRGTAKYILKGNMDKMEGYSAFFKGKGVTGREPAPLPGSEEFQRKTSGLHELLVRNKINTLYVCGTAQNVCVCDTVFDAVALGYKVTMVNDACRALPFETEYIDPPKKTVAKVRNIGGIVCDVEEVGFAQGSTDEDARLYNSLMAEETPLRIMPANLNPSLRKKYERSVAIWDGY